MGLLDYVISNILVMIAIYILGFYKCTVHNCVLHLFLLCCACFLNVSPCISRVHCSTHSCL